MRPKMFLMCGHCGSGKSTFARQFAKEHNLRYLAIDDMYAAFNGDPQDRNNKFDVWMTFWRQIHAAEMAGHDIIIDTNAPTMVDRTEFLNWFPTFEHHLIWIKADEELCLMNNAQRKRVIPVDVMKKLFNEFEDVTYVEFRASELRSSWKSISCVININNHFDPLRIYWGWENYPYKEA